MSPPLISRDSASAEFFDGARSGHLLIQRCTTCEHPQFALTGLSAGVTRCRNCGTPAPPWVPSSGSGTIVSFTIIPGRRAGDGPPSDPSIAAIVELDEGPWVMAPLEAPVDEVSVAARVRVQFRQPGTDGEPLPVFALAG